MQFFILIIKGVLLGCTAIIPGISFGTMALVLNVYEKAIDGFTLMLVPKNWKSHFVELSLFFIPLAVGVLIAMVLFASIMKFLLDTYPVFVQLAFLGIIIGSLPYIYTQHLKDHINIKSIPFILIGSVIILFFSFSDVFFPNTTASPESSDIVLTMSLSGILFALLLGTISSACGLIPGISGSFVLLILGFYSTYLTIVKQLYFPLLVPLFIGHIIGLVLTAVVLKVLLHRFEMQSYSVIFGLILASMLGIFPWQDISSGFISSSIGLSIVRILLGLLCVGGGILLSRLSMIQSNKLIKTRK